MTGKRGPNDMSGVLFGPKVCFLFSFSSYFILITKYFYHYRSYLYFGDARRVRVDDNGPKYVFFFLFLHVLFVPITITGPIYRLKMHGWLGWATTGPGYAFFSFFLRVFVY